MGDLAPESYSLDPYLTRVFILKLGPTAPITSEDICVLTVESGGSEREREDVPLPPVIVEFLKLFNADP
jgi:hypothetical protein